jgi:GNAT superfamily N-acetyltransferase
MTGIGYEYRNNFEHVMPYRRFFTKAGYFHVHSVAVTSEFWKRHIAFRDYLRTHDDVRDEYFFIKKELSLKEWNETNDYAIAKTNFIQRTEEKAKQFISGKIEIAEAEALTDIYYNMPQDTLKDSEIEFLYDGNFLAMKSAGISKFLVNRVIGLGIKKDVTPDDLNNIFSFYKNHPHPANISLSPYTGPENIKNFFTGNGFSNRETWNKFYRCCEPVSEAGTSLKVEEINEKYANAFAEIVVTVFENPPELKPNVSSLVGRKNWYHYLAFDNNLPVAAGSLYKCGDTAWFGMATTLPEYRNKGAQSAIIAKRINKAHELGCNWISVETMPHSVENPNPSYLNLLRYGFNFMYERPNFVLNSRI